MSPTMLRALVVTLILGALSLMALQDATQNELNACKAERDNAIGAMDQF